MLTSEQRAEGRRLLAALTPGDWSFSDGAIHTEDESGGAWVPSYTDHLGELNETALADGLAIEWLIRHADALLAEPPTIDVEAIKRDAVREFAEAITSELSAKAKRLYRESEEASPIADVMLSGIGKGQEFAAETIRKLAAARGVNLDEKP